MTEGVIETLTPVSDHGPFRVRLLGIDYPAPAQLRAGGWRPGPRARSSPAGRPCRSAGQLPQPSALARLNPITSEHFTAQLLIAEPRLSLAPHSELRLLEALDDHGNSLVYAGRHPQSLNYPGYFGAPHGSVLETHAQLQRPADPGDTIKTLRGTIPVTVSSRRPGPLVVPLLKSAGKTLRTPIPR